MLITEYKQKVIALLYKHNYKHINNQHDMLVQFTDCTLLEDIVYYLYCKRMVEANRIIHTQHEFLYLIPGFASQFDRYIEPAKLELRKYKLNKIISQ